MIDDHERPEPTIEEACPFCGCDWSASRQFGSDDERIKQEGNVGLVIDEWDCQTEHTEPGWYVACANCMVEKGLRTCGPMRHTRREAIEAWNTRP